MGQMNLLESETVKYLSLVILLIVFFVLVHNLAVSEEDTYDIGYCRTFIVCDGVRISGNCIGVEHVKTRCTDPVNESEPFRNVEVKCLLQGNVLCKNSSITGKEWAEIAVYENKTCKEWAESDPRIDILGCNKMFGTVLDYAEKS